MPTLGRFFRSRHDYHRWLWICEACDGQAPRLRRKDKETPIEASVRRSLKEAGFRALAEYPLGPFIYDFAVPKLRLLLEVDSKGWHRTRDQRGRDGRKSAFAAENHWKLVRVHGQQAGNDAMMAVLTRASELGHR